MATLTRGILPFIENFHLHIAFACNLCGKVANRCLMKDREGFARTF